MADPDSKKQERDSERDHEREREREIKRELEWRLLEEMITINQDNKIKNQESRH